MGIAHPAEHGGLGASGVGFAGANLILARYLSTEQYALFTLFIALGNLGYSLGPAGIDGVVNRRHLEAGPALLDRAPVAFPARGTGLRGDRDGGLRHGSPAGGDAVRLLRVRRSNAGGGGQVPERAAIRPLARRVAEPNIVLILAALASAAAHVGPCWPPAVISTVGFVGRGAYTGGSLFGERHQKEHQELRVFVGRGAVLRRAQRLGAWCLSRWSGWWFRTCCPSRDLALYGVLGAIAGSLFRVLQMGVGFSLLPRLRAATSVPNGGGYSPTRRGWWGHRAAGLDLHLVHHAGGRAPVPRREVPPAGLAGPGGIVSGIAKIANAFTKAAASALADPRELSLVNVTGWVSAGLALAGAFAGAHWGLAGVIYGVGIGWFVRAVVAFALIVRHLRLPVSRPPTTTTTRPRPARRDPAGRTSACEGAGSGAGGRGAHGRARRDAHAGA